RVAGLRGAGRRHPEDLAGQAVPVLGERAVAGVAGGGEQARTAAEPQAAAVVGVPARDAGEDLLRRTDEPAAVVPDPHDAVVARRGEEEVDPVVAAVGRG